MSNNKQPVKLNNKTILVTGSSGFIGANLVMCLLTDTSFMNVGTIIYECGYNNFT